MKKFLIIANTASMIHLFNSVNLEVMKNAGYEIHIACNFIDGNTSSAGEVREYIKDWNERGFILHEIGFLRSPFSLKSFGIYKETKKLIRSCNFDIIHCHTPIVSVFVRLAARKMRKHGTKVIYTAHGFHFYSGCPIFNWLTYYPIEKLLAPFTDALITINREDYERAVKKLHTKRIIPMNGIGVDVDGIIRTPSDIKRTREDLGLKTDDILLISIGELNTNKNHRLIVSALPEIISMAENKNIHYLIAGIGYAAHELPELARRYGVEDRLHLLGFRRDVYSLLKASDIFVFPSYREGLSVALMEAMASGLPVIASNIRGNTDLIDNMLGGYLISPGDITAGAKAISKLVDSPDLRESMGKYNQQKIHSYDKNSVAYVLIDLIKDLESEENINEYRTAASSISKEQQYDSRLAGRKRN